MSVIRRIALLLLALPACVPPNDPLTTPHLDHALFVAQVEPVLEARCANPSCHGNDSRPLRVYAPLLFRMDPTRLHYNEPLTTEEVAANESSASAFAVGIARAEDSLLLTKSVGQAWHIGGSIFADANDREYEAILTWLRSGGLP